MNGILPQTLRGSFSAVSTPIFQVNTRWKTLDEIYKIYICVFGERRTEIENDNTFILLHCSDLKISAKFALLLRIQK